MENSSSVKDSVAPEKEAENFAFSASFDAPDTTRDLEELPTPPAEEEDFPYPSHEQANLTSATALERSAALDSILRIFNSHFHVLFAAALISGSNCLCAGTLFFFTDFNKPILAWFFVSFALIAFLTATCVSQVYKKEARTLYSL